MLVFAPFPVVNVLWRRCWLRSLACRFQVPRAGLCLFGCGFHVFAAETRSLLPFGVVFGLIMVLGIRGAFLGNVHPFA